MSQEKEKISRREKTPVSIILLWIITIFAVVMSIISLIGLIISRHGKVKKAFLGVVEKKFAIHIENIDIKLFPLSKSFEIKLEGVKNEFLRIKEISVRPFDIRIDSISAGEVFHSDKIKIEPGKIDVELLKISIPSGGGGVPDLKPVCEITKSFYESKIGKIAEYVPSFFLKGEVKIEGFELQTKDFSSFSDKLTLSLSKFYFEVPETRIKLRFKNPNFPESLRDRFEKTEVNLRALGNLKNLDAIGYVKIRDGIISASLDFSLSLCKEKELSLKLKGETLSDLKTFITEANSSILEIYPEIELSISDRKLEVKAFSKINLENFQINDRKIGGFQGNIELIYKDEKIHVYAEISGDGLEKLELSGDIPVGTSKGAINFSGEIDLQKTKFLENSKGKILVDGIFYIPDLTAKISSEVKDFNLDFIQFKEFYGDVSIGEGKNLKFKGILVNNKSHISVSGGVEDWKNISISLYLDNSGAKDSLEVMKLSIPFDALISSSRVNIDIDPKSKIVHLTSENITARDFKILKENISCIRANIEGRVHFSGNFSIDIEGEGKDGVLRCNDLADSRFDFSAHINQDILKLKIENGKYDLKDFGMLPFGLEGDAEFSGEIESDLRKTLYGNIKVLAENFRFSEYPLSSSCVLGDVIIEGSGKVSFQGKTCEEFEISLTYQNEKIFGSISKGETFVKFSGDNLEGSGKIEDISSILNRRFADEGFFSLKYNIPEKSGNFDFESPYVKVANFGLRNVSFSSGINRGILNFYATAYLKEDELALQGEYDIQNKKMQISILPKTIAQIPVSGKINITGTLDKPFISGEIKISQFQFDTEKIDEIKNLFAGEIELERENKIGIQEDNAEGTLNIVVILENIYLKESFGGIKLNGRINITGKTSDPQIVGVFQILDGGFSFADTEFSKVTGLAIMKEGKIFLNISGKTEIITFENEKFTLQLRVVGNLDNPSVYLSSIPSLSQADIMCVLAFLRRCKSVEDYKNAFESATYRGLSIALKKVQSAITPEDRAIRTFFTPTEFGFLGKVGGINYRFSQNIFEGINYFSLSRDISDNLSMIMSWDNRKYGYSLFGNMGNLGLDLRTTRRF